MKCPWCLQRHALRDCPLLPKSQTEIRDSLAERLMLYRATKNALIGYAKQNGFPFPESILSLDPDYRP